MSNKVLINGSIELLERPAHEALTPAMLLELTSAGKWKKQTVSGALPMVVIADINRYYSSNSNTAALDDAYAEDDVVFGLIPQKGARVQVRVANGENIARGDYLVSNGDGTVKERTSEVTALFVADAACDMSDSSGADPEAIVEAIVI